MYTIKEAARLSGVTESSLRAWERRYGVVVPQRNESGYRVYSLEDLAAISSMRRLVENGWSAAQAASAVRTGSVPAVAEPALVPESLVAPDDPRSRMRHLQPALHLCREPARHRRDRGQPRRRIRARIVRVRRRLVAVPNPPDAGNGWADGEVDIAAEHAASHAVHRRLSSAFEAAGSRSRGPAVVVGLPSGSQHDLGALAFATAIRRRGADVLYLGANVPVDSWETAVRSRAAHAAVLAVVTPADRPTALAVAERLLAWTFPRSCAAAALQGRRWRPESTAWT